MGDYGLADFGFLLLGGILGPGCLTIIVIGILAVRSKHRAQQTYVPVEAVVFSQRLIDDGGGDGGISYEPKIDYEYVVDGVTYRSSNVWAGPDDSYAVSLKRANELLDQFPKGQKVQAYYDPADPNQAFLLHDPPALLDFLGHVFLFGCGVLIVVLFSIAWSVGLLWELVAAHFVALFAAFGWFAWAIRRERNIKS